MNKPWQYLNQAPRDGTPILLAICRDTRWDYTAVYWDGSKEDSYPWIQMDGQNAWAESSKTLAWCPIDEPWDLSDDFWADTYDKKEGLE